MKWLKNLFRKQPKTWQWYCCEAGCDAQGVGNEDEVRSKSMWHALQNMHTVKGGEQ